MLTRLPSVGPKTAERYVFFLFKQNPEELQKFAQSIAELKEKTVICKNCHMIAESNPCPICADSKRSVDTICIVSDTRNMIAIESTNAFKGVYHVLGGLINKKKQETMSGLPGLSKIPLLKYLFGSKEKDWNSSQLIVAITPTVVEAGASEVDVDVSLKKRLEASLSLEDEFSVDLK